MVDHNKRKKKRGRSKLFTSCFRSFDTDERPISYRKPDSRSCVNGRAGKTNLIAVSGRKEEEDVAIQDACLVNGSGDDRSVERSSCGGGVSRLLKAVLFDSVMVKKICSSSKPSISSDTSESFQSIENPCKPSDETNGSVKESTDIEDSSSRCSNLLSSSSRTTSSSYSSSSSSSTNSNSRWLSEPKTSPPTDVTDSTHPTPSTSSSSQKPNRSSSQTDSIHVNPHEASTSLPLAKSNSIPQSSSHHKRLSQSDSFDSRNSVSSDPIKSNLNLRWCLLLLLSLVVLVMYGRVYSILCTSIWFYLIPCRRVRVNSVTNSTGSMDTESEQYKKRVIMAGLLDRTRNQLR